MKFEEAMAELEKTVQAMERSDVPLEEILAGYAKGTKLLAFCRHELNEFERKIELLTGDDGENGEWRELQDTANIPEAEVSPRISTDVEFRSSAPAQRANDGELPF